MANLTDQIKQAFNALGMANAGEVSGRYRMEAALRPGPDAPGPSHPGQQGRRWIALGIGATWPRPQSESSMMCFEVRSISGRSVMEPAPSRTRSSISTSAGFPSRQGTHLEHDSTRLKAIK